MHEFIDSKTEEAKAKDDFINNFVKWIFEKVVMTTIICSNTETAIQIFNVLNNRGMPLTSVDILKSRLMVKLSNERKKEFKNLWQQIKQN